MPEDARVVRRVVAEGRLVLETSAHFGGGDAPDVDMALFSDADGDYLLPGSTLAGCLRSAIASRMMARGEFEDEDGLSAEPKSLQALFGEPALSGLDSGGQSAVIIDDVHLMPPQPSVPTQLATRRDSVRIDPRTGTAADGDKYDFEVLQPGSGGSVRLELVLRQGREAFAEELLGLFQGALDLLEAGEVSMGAKTRRGLGQLKVSDWRVKDYRLSDRADALAWLADALPAAGTPDRLDVAAPGWPAPDRAEFDMLFRLRGPLLVRTAPSELSAQEDAVQFQVRDLRTSKARATVPGTTWAGILRARARKIAITAGYPDTQVDRNLVDGIFGPVHLERAGTSGQALTAGRISISESVVDGTLGRTQARIRINRFTGGVARGGLFEERPDWPSTAGVPHLRLKMHLRHPEDHEVALLLLTIKDLWTGDLPVGGGSSVGRGTLAGCEGSLRADDHHWKWSDADPGSGRLSFDAEDDADLMEIKFGAAWRSWLDQAARGAEEEHP
jgi:CRISPR/Cas system CSM-associated protein Csm3 (group 7 of RAMP superfamily)